MVQAPACPLSATGVLGFEFIGYKAVRSLHYYDVGKRNFISASIERSKDHLVETSLGHYDGLMETIEPRTQGSLSLAHRSCNAGGIRLTRTCNLDGGAEVTAQ